MSTPAYEYGRLLRELRDGYVRMAEQILAGFNGIQLPTSMTEGPETASIRRYRLAVSAERRKGLAYVDQLIRDARRDMGLGQ